VQSLNLMLGLPEDAGLLVAVTAPDASV